MVDFTYDDNDRLVDMRDALGHRNTMVYDAVSNVIAQGDANNNRTTYSYDSRNRLTTITDALSHSTVLGYDAAGNQVTIKDALNNTTTIAYDALNRGTTQTDARGGVITLAYDGAGRTTGLTDPVGNRTTWSYDLADRMTTMTDALGTATYAYDAGDQLVDKTDRAGRRTTFAFDSGGRITNERWFNGSTILRTMTFTYDAANQLTGATDPDATLTFTYDSGGRMTSAATSSAAGQPNVTLSYTYNESGDRISMTDNLSSVGRTTYSYDAAHRLTTMTRSMGGTAGPQVIFGYDAANRKTSISRTIGGTGTAVTSSFAYDNANRLTTLTHQVSGGSGLATYVYGYDDVNRATSETNAEGSVTYTYDATNQLTGVTGARSESYSYDLNGNRTMTGYSTGAGNQLTASPGYTYAYDGDGNLASKTETATGKITTFSYDHHNRMTGATRTASGSVEMLATYAYDPLGRRILTNVDADGNGTGVNSATWSVFDGLNTYADFNGSGSLLARYQHGLGVDELLSRTIATGVSTWYLPDRLGSIRDLSDSSGAVIGHRAYDSFGQTINETGSTLDRFTFTGREYNLEANLYFYRARYYDSALGQFTGLDPMGFAAGDARLYGYTSNNAVNAIDPMGEYIIILNNTDNLYWFNFQFYTPRNLPKNALFPIRVGHVAIIIGDETSGYDYFSFAPSGFHNGGPFVEHGSGEIQSGHFGPSDRNPNSSTTLYQQIMTLMRDKYGYDRLKLYQTNKAEENRARQAINKFLSNKNNQYHIKQRDCVTFVDDAMRAAFSKWRSINRNDFPDTTTNAVYLQYGGLFTPRNMSNYPTTLLPTNPIRVSTPGQRR